MQDKDCPVRILTAFADELEPGKLVRIGWIQGGDRSSRAWLRAKSAARYSEVLLATLHVAAAHFGLCGCIGARIGRSVASLEATLGCVHSFVWWW